MSAPSTTSTPAANNSHKLKAVLFDVDGTMADTDHYHRRVFTTMLKPYGIHMDDEYYDKECSGQSNRNLRAKLLPNMSEQEGNAVLVEKERLFRQLCEHELSPLPGFIELVQRLRSEGVKMAAVTNAPKPNAVFMIRLFGLASIEHDISPEGCSGPNGSLDTVVLGDDCQRAKPDPEAYLIAMQRLGVQPHECVIFEDSKSGVTAGVRSGARVCGVLTTMNEAQMRELGADEVIDNYTQVDADQLLDSMDRFSKRPSGTSTATDPAASTSKPHGS